jgi:Predicted dithiol-disulfide isomerase involved in polyketide biosynthesis
MLRVVLIDNASKIILVMKIEIWADVVCPFCYIGKRKLDAALKDFSHADRVKVEWKSYQLAPDVIPEPGKSVVSYFAERKQISEDEAHRIYRHVAQLAKNNGIDFRLSDAVICNTFNAHRLSHLAKSYGLQSEVEEQLFAAYFTQGKDLNDFNVLAKIGAEVGLEVNAVWQMLIGNQFADEVKWEVAEAGQLGVQGVPFFVFDRKYAISGAQEQAFFKQTLEKAWAECLPIFREENVIKGEGGTIDRLL